MVKADGSVRHGTAVDVDKEGALLVRFTDNTTETVNSGEVSVRGMYGYVYLFVICAQNLEKMIAFF